MVLQLCSHLFGQNGTLPSCTIVSMKNEEDFNASRAPAYLVSFNQCYAPYNRRRGFSQENILQSNSKLYLIHAQETLQGWFITLPLTIEWHAMS